MCGVTPRYASIFLERWCPRNCGYCASKHVKVGRLLRPDEWLEAFGRLRDEGVRFFLVVGNDSLLYPWIVDLVRGLEENGFHGMYAMYTTFPEPWYSRLREKLVDAGIYSVSCGVDVVAGCLTGDSSIDEKSIYGLEQLVWFRERGVPDLQATVTIHGRNYKFLDRVFDVITANRIWIGTSMIEYSVDGLHDFFGTRESLESFLIPEREGEEFRRKMYDLAGEVRKGRWMFQLPPEYLELLGDMRGEPRWHCTLPLIVSIEADGSFRLCAYRPFYEHRGHTVFELGREVSMSDYVVWYNEESSKCPGCAWGYPYMAEHWYHRDVEFGDKVLQFHKSRYWVRK